MRAQDQFRSRFSVICDIDVANPVSLQCTLILPLDQTMLNQGCKFSVYKFSRVCVRRHSLSYSLQFPSQSCQPSNLLQSSIMSQW